jgi:hypothetical protein
VRVPESRPSRRETIAALLGAAALPGLAASAAAGSADHPDRQLLELGAEYDRLQAIEDAAYEQEALSWAAYEREEPERSDVLRHRLEDHLVFQFPVSLETETIAADPKLSDFYTADEVGLLRYAPPPLDPGRIAEQRQRAGEITAEHARWVAQCDDLRERSGVTAAGAALEGAVRAQRDVARLIATTPASTIAGLQVRARIFAEIHGIDPAEKVDGTDPTDRLKIFAIIRDLAAMNGETT